MKYFNLLVLFLISLQFTGGILLSPPTVLAAVSCYNQSLNLNYRTIPDSPIPEGKESISVVLEGAESGKYYRLRFGTGFGIERFTDSVQSQGGSATFIVTKDNFKLNPGKHVATVETSNDSSFNTKTEFCGDLSYTVGFGTESCKLQFNPSNPRANEKLAIRVSGAPQGSYAISFREGTGDATTDIGRIQVDENGNGTATTDRSIDKVSPKMNIFLLQASGTVIERYKQFCVTPISVTAAGDQAPRDPQTPSSTQPGSNLPVIPGCSEGRTDCTKAAGQSCGQGASAGIQTAIGCVPTDPVTLINRLLSFGIGAAGGIALLLMMIGSFEMVTSQGDPKALANGRERFVSALIGLLFILFSVVFLKIIGVDILGLDTITKVFNAGS